MDIERVFMSCCYKMEKEPEDIFNLIHFALCVGAFKYPQQFEKRKDKLINFLMNPSMKSAIEEDDDDDGDDEEEEEEEVIDGIGTQQITAQSDKPLEKKKIRIVIKKTTAQVAPPKKHNNCNAVTETELKPRLETDNLVQQQLDVVDKQGTSLESHNTTTMASRKRMSLMNESTKRLQIAPPRVKQLLSDSSFEKQLDRDKQLQKQSHKGFKKMENDHDTEKKKEEGAQQTPIQRMRRRKECTTGSTKMNVDPKQRNCSVVAKPVEKDTEGVTDMKKKFESSKRKFEERLAEQREAKRRVVMVDFHDMPKPASDPRPPKCCWNRNRKRF